MEIFRLRRTAAALLLSLPMLVGAGVEARAGDGAGDLEVKTSRGAWSVREARIRDSERFRRIYSQEKRSRSKTRTRMGFSTFSRDGDDRKMAVLRYATPLSLGPGDFILKVRAPGGRRSLMRVELEF